MSCKVLLTESVSSQGIDLLKKSAEVRIAPSPLLADLLPLIADADALLVRSSPAAGELMKGGPKLKVIARHGIGVDNIDLDAAEGILDVLEGRMPKYLVNAEVVGNARS
jgi:D-3-phosphoglycerate dehydrogenase